jgi:hypothetical protein
MSSQLAKDVNYGLVVQKVRSVMLASTLHPCISSFLVARHFTFPVLNLFGLVVFRLFFGLCLHIFRLSFFLRLDVRLRLFLALLLYCCGFLRFFVIAAQCDCCRDCAVTVISMP